MIGTFVLKAPQVPGEHEMNFLFYYDTIFNEGEKKHSLTHRIHTHTAYVQVVSSIEANSSVSRSDVNEDNVTEAYGSISIENIGRDGSPESYKITSIIAISKTWKVMAIQDTYDESTLELPPGILTQLYFIANKRNQDFKDQVENNYTLTTILELEKTPGIDYNYDLLSIQDKFSNLAKSKGQFSILFLIKWRTINSEYVHYGTDYLIPDYIDPWNDPMFNPANIDIQNESKVIAPSPHQLINFSLMHPESVTHDFTLQPLCIQSISFNFQNISGQDVFIKVQLNSQSQEERQDYRWVGATVRKFKLKPFEFFSTQHNIIFSGEGVYNLMNCTVTASNEQRSNFLPQLGAQMSNLIVERPEQNV